MAYGNWGAYVYKNGERQPSREDNTPYLEDDTPPGYYQAFGRSETKLDPHHASLGSGHFRLCGYKSYPVIFWEGESIDTAQYQKDPNAFWFDSDGIEGEIGGYKFKATPGEYPERVELELIEPDGTKWTGTSGYAMGRGWDD